MPENIVIHWFRRDLRLHDNTALCHALEEKLPILPLFIFDTDILQHFNNPHDIRISFIYNELQKINILLKEKYNSSLLIKHGKVLPIWHELSQTYSIKAVFTNRDYEPYAQQRDRTVYNFLTSQNIVFKGFKDHVIFEKNEILKPDSKPYTVYTPYSKKWIATFETQKNSFLSQNNPAISLLAPAQPLFYQPQKAFELPTLNELGYQKTDLQNIPQNTINEAIIEKYEQTRNFPALTQGTTQLGIHLRFGTISIRQLVYKALKINNFSFLNELIWRDFYQAILFHFPHVQHSAFKPAYNALEWRNNEAEFEKWCNAQTGYPIVDAGITQLNTTGYMHNRVRMIVASFLTKHLLIDWRWGEAYFAQKLIDFELASNNGGWQWAAGSGCDAAPYFRIFNPYEQQKKFDANNEYIKQWLPNYNSASYKNIPPIVEHTFARNRCLTMYKKVLNSPN